MRITKLYIEKYKTLEQFSISFSEDINLIIGKNGSGKSAILETLAYIFGNANLFFIEKKKQKPDFNFQIEYEINYKGANKTIVLSGNKTKRGYWSWQIDGKEGNKVENHADYLPQNVIIYYSGLSETMSSMVEQHEKIYSEELLKQKRTEIGVLPITYIHKHHFSILLAALCSFSEYEKLNNFFERILHIKPENILISLKKTKASWATSNAKEFWGAKGKLKDFLDVLSDNKESEGKVRFDKDAIHYSLSIEDWYALRRDFGIVETDIFYYLEMLYYSDILENITVTFKNTETGILFSSLALSEGERQYLTIFAITELLIKENTLLLFDEPDTYMHPVWQNTFIENIRHNIQDDPRKPQFILTSHSPNIVSNLYKQELHILRTNENKSQLKTVTFNPYGQSIENVLIDFFDIETLRYAVKGRIDELWHLIKSNAYESEIFVQKFEEFKGIVGQSDKDVMRMNLEIANRKKLREQNNEKDK